MADGVDLFFNLGKIKRVLIEVFSNFVIDHSYIATWIQFCGADAVLDIEFSGVGVQASLHSFFRYCNAVTSQDAYSIVAARGESGDTNQSQRWYYTMMKQTRASDAKTPTQIRVASVDEIPNVLRFWKCLQINVCVV
ncbi:hypothetical protein E2542_SST31331 [Spatholobus suberectus]|nr:hypothetical protein E2542_SST31331 [Spatholobus suberectus]